MSRIRGLPLILLLLVMGCGHGPDPVPAPEIPEPDFPAEPSAPLRYPVLTDDPEVTGGITTTGTDPAVEHLLSSLTPRQRIGQRFIAHVPGTRLTYGAGRAIVEVNPAGFILYPWNYSTADDVRTLTSALDRFARSITPGIGLLLCADQEGGRVRAFRFADIVSLPSAATFGRLVESTGTQPVKAAAYLTGLQLRELGVNMNLAPVLDVFEGDPQSVIGDRSYSADTELVTQIVPAYLAGAGRAGIISVAKHFPGHGVTTIDSHVELPIVDHPQETIRETHLPPFVAAIRHNVEVIMTAHVVFSSYDPHFPASLSRVFLRDILRDELGYTGVVMSDGLEMGALRNNYGLDETLVRMFKNDVDLILLFVSDDVVDIVDRVEQLIATGRISEEDVDRGVRRVLALKLKHGIAEYLP